ncbi:PIN domain-containing protein [Pontibacter sp. HSC-14F20]|uniref:PIN domain-containing protein n=1 Tax=Pontibacter sp. HSC-14F20 TaxID=2864136 RepID=UPI001C72DED7|nr:PIN domain-containing protein [Pontibacter sp. HSC-14F20]MBX0333426.1 PIN domain-containing protein [Pontibacter sp. HSC-14F20]
MKNSKFNAALNTNSVVSVDLYNVFIDSDILYKDPFFKNEFSDLLLKLAKDKKLTIYISAVVYEETLNNYKEIVSKEVAQLVKHQRNLSKLKQSDYYFKYISVENYEKEFVDFYQLMFSNGTFKILNYSNDVLPELVNRSIKRLKPFSDKKQEFRDGIIWLSIIEEIKSKGLSNNFFITNNIQDYYDEDKVSLHTSLIKDCSNILPFTSTKDFLLTHIDLSRLEVDFDFIKWLEEQNIDENYILKNIKDKTSDTLVEKFSIAVSDYVISYPDASNVAFFDIKIDIGSIKISEIQKRVIGTFAYLTCPVSLDFTANVLTPDLINRSFITQERGFKATCELNFYLHKESISLSNIIISLIIKN